MSVARWSRTPALNSVADPTVPASPGMPARDISVAIRGIMAGVRIEADAKGGALKTTGTQNAYVVSGAGITELRSGLALLVKVDRNNTAAATLNVDGLGPLPWVDAGGVPLQAGRILQGRFYATVLDTLADGSASAWRVQAGASTLDEIPGLTQAVAAAALDAERAETAADGIDSAVAQSTAAQAAADAAKVAAQASATSASQAANIVVARGSPTAVQVGNYGLEVPIVIEAPAGDFILGGWDTLGRFDTHYQPDRITAVVGAYRYEPLVAFEGEPPNNAVVDSAGNILFGHTAEGRPIIANLTDDTGQEIVLGSRGAAPYISGGDLYLAGREAPLGEGGDWLSAAPFYGYILAARQYATIGPTATFAVERAPVGIPTLWIGEITVDALILGDGQSNMAGSGGFGPTDAGAGAEEREFKTPPYSDTLMLDTNVVTASDVRGSINRTSGASWTPLDPDTIIGYTPLMSRQYTTSSHGETSMEAAAIYLQKDLTEKLGISARTISFNSGIGGASVRVLSKNPQGSNDLGESDDPYNDIMKVAAKVKNLSEAEGRRVWVPYLAWNQGQSDDNYSGYKADMLAYMATRIPELKALLGQAGPIPILSAQPVFEEAATGGGYFAALGQYELHIDPAVDFWIVCPEYAALARGSTSFKGYTKDNLHHNALGHRDEGERRHNYFMGLLSGVRPKRTRPILLTQAGNVATMKFEMNVAPLVIDTTTISNPGNAGLRLFAADDSEITINSYVKVGSDSIAMTVPNGATVSYGTTGLKGYQSDFIVRGSDTFASYLQSEIPRTCIRDSDPAVSRYDGAPLWNWCLYSKIARTV